MNASAVGCLLEMLDIIGHGILLEAHVNFCYKHVNVM